MKHNLYKMLFDKNPDGSVTYTPEDLEKITEEDALEQGLLQTLLGDSFNALLDEINKPIDGIAEFAYGDKYHASRVDFEYADEPHASYGIATVSIDIWGEKLNQTRICREGEIIENWKLSEQSGSHRLIFTRKIPREMVTQVKFYPIF